MNDQRSTEGETSELSASRRLSESQLQNELNVLHVRRVVAGNPNTPRQVLLRLAGDRSTLIRCAVAANPKSPPELLKILAQDRNSEVRLAVAENTNTPWDVLTDVAHDADADVRYGLAENPYMPEDILLSLVQDDNPYVVSRALKTLEMLAPDAKTKLRIKLQRAVNSAKDSHFQQSPRYSF